MTMANEFQTATPRKSSYAELAVLREENDHLRAEVAYLKERLDYFASDDPAMLLPREWKLSPTQRKLLMMLYRSDVVLSVHAIHSLLYDDESDVQLKTVDVHISMLRKALNRSRSSVNIINRWGKGYSLASDSIAIIRGILEPGGSKV